MMNDQFFRVTTDQVKDRITSDARQINNYNDIPQQIGGTGVPGELFLGHIPNTIPQNYNNNNNNQFGLGCFEQLKASNLMPALPIPTNVQLFSTLKQEFIKRINTICKTLTAFNNAHGGEKYIKERQLATMECFKCCNKIVEQFDGLMTNSIKQQNLQSGKNITKLCLDGSQAEQDRFVQFVNRKHKQLLNNLNSDFPKLIIGCDNIFVKPENINNNMLVNQHDTNYDQFEKDMLYSTFCIRDKQPKTITLHQFATGISIAIYKEMQKAVNTGADFDDQNISNANNAIRSFLYVLSGVFQEGIERAKKTYDVVVNTIPNANNSELQDIKNKFVKKYSAIYSLIQRTISNNKQEAAQRLALLNKQFPNSNAAYALRGLIETFDSYAQLFHDNNQEQLFGRDIRQASTGLKHVNNGPVNYSKDTLTVYTKNPRFV